MYYPNPNPAQYTINTVKRDYNKAVGDQEGSKDSEGLMILGAFPDLK